MNKRRKHVWRKVSDFPVNFIVLRLLGIRTVLEICQNVVCIFCAVDSFINFTTKDRGGKAIEMGFRCPALGNASLYISLQLLDVKSILE